MTFTDDQITELIVAAERHSFDCLSMCEHYDDLVSALAQVKAERDEARAKVRGLGFSLGGTQAENAALRDAIREAQIALHIHVKLSGLPFPSLEDILAAALATERGDAS